MANRYHIKDDGLPGQCSAASASSCPKTKAGDPFHGSLAEAVSESERRFQDKLGLFETQEKAVEAPAVAEPRSDAESTALDSNMEVYRHPQGKTITVQGNRIVSIIDKHGKSASSSATVEKLRSGYGSWSRGEGIAAAAPAMSNKPALGAAQRIATPVPGDDPKPYIDKLAKEEGYYAYSVDRLNEFNRRVREYDERYGEREGRAWHYGQNFEKVPGVSPDRATQYTARDVDTAARIDLQAQVSRAAQMRDDAQTALEVAGFGHKIPDRGKTIRVRTQAQKWLLEDELKGQISDGHWENASNNPWEDWTGATVIVDPQNPGRNFFTSKDNYQLNSRELLDAVGDRMVDNVRAKTGQDDYSFSGMNEDLRDLRRIFKTHRASVE